MLVLVTRPRAQAEATLAALRALGHEGLLDPVLDIEPLPFSMQGEVAVVVLTSANAVSALSPALMAKPVFAVGEATAAAARAAGCAQVRAGDADGRALAALIAREVAPGAGVVLHPAAAETREGLEAGLTAAGFAYRHVAAYRAVPAGSLGPEQRAALAEGRLGAAMFLSPRSAEIWSILVRQAGLADRLGPVLALCLSPAVAAGIASLGWREVRVAATRDHAALLACLDDGGRR